MPRDQHRADSGSILIDQITDWLMAEALGDADLKGLVEGTALRVQSAGIPIQRLHISYNTLHPLYETISLTWQRGKGTQMIERPHSPEDNPQWVRSPFYFMIHHRQTTLRRRLAGKGALMDFDILAEFKRDGATDYFAFAIPFSTALEVNVVDGLAGSWTTDRRSGFTDSDLRALMRVQRRLAVACRMMIRGQVASNVVTTYLGQNAGERVLQGQIRRGDGETIRAVIWYSDLRGSTAMAETMGREDFIGVLNDYFECAADAVQAEGGQVLNFIGDAVLAIFPLTKNRGEDAEACRRALAAARNAHARLDRVNAIRAHHKMPALSFGLALHLGDVMFGNIGTAARLSFNVIGPTVNEVARLEGLTKTLHRPLLVSGSFADALPGEWEALGEHDVRGSARRIAVFAPKAAGQV